MTRRLTESRLVVASHNAGKIVEIGALLAPFAVEAVSVGDLGLPEPEETGDSYAANARLKAHAAAAATGLPALGDDSGLGVEALGGAPGIYSARWAETPSGRDFGHAMRVVRDELDAQQVPAPRRAAFVCVLALAWPDGHDEIFEGRTAGQLVWPPRGENGFGYDPIFLPDGHSHTFGEMRAAEKQELSHRARAFRLLVQGVLA